MNSRPTRLRPALPALAVAVVAVAATLGPVSRLAAVAQGIPFVTRRTATVEKQVPARRFFDAAGISTAGAVTNAPGSTAPAGPALATRPSEAARTTPTSLTSPGRNRTVPGSPPTGLAARPPATGVGNGSTAGPANAASRSANTAPFRLPPPGPARGYIVNPGPAVRTLPRPTNSPALRPPPPIPNHAYP